jgi:AAA+ superfamily predicted ATPase
MATDPSVLAAIAEALKRDPNSVPLRLHLASLLLASGAEMEALEHYVAVLNLQPANLAALEGAAAAAAAVGDLSRAEGFRTLHDAMVGKSQAPPATTPPPVKDEAEPPPEPVAAASDERQAVGVGPTAGEQPWWEAEWPELTLADVGGMEKVKQRLNVAFLGPLRNPELRRAYGKSLRGGLLLYGPPGCGKTFIARATAGEMKAKFMGVGLSDVLDMWLGQSEKHLHETFETARRNAPCVLFFDELDALGQKRTNLRMHGPTRNLVNQLLAEMDGVATNNEGVFILGATNHPWDVDSAMLRPGRFDRMLLVLPPDQEARHSIVRYHLQDKPAQVDLELVAAHTEDFSGADLAHLCESATEIAMEESMQTGRVRSITTADFQRALKDVRPSTRAWFETARNFVLFANEAGTYDELMNYMRSKKLL